jgi:hypothetical protein
MKNWILIYMLLTGNYLFAQVIPVGFMKSKVSTGPIIFNVDAANASSYSGTGNVWNDLSGSNNNIKFYSSSTYSVNANPTFDSDGGGSLVTTGIFGKSINDSGISGSVARSMEAWVKFNSVGSNAVISIGAMNGGKLFELMALNSNIIEHYWGNFTTSSTTVATNTWYHIVIVYDGTSKHYIYINGNQVGLADTPTLIMNTSNTPINIGTTNWGGFNGKIAALRIYNYALTSSDVTTKFNALKTRFGL